ncbi:MAG: hypothetical protein HZB29_08715 [Nitrospinae bacterium]|nr:hypothetical protein [Nitrospinota bacterium]
MSGLTINAGIERHEDLMEDVIKEFEIKLPARDFIEKAHNVFEMVRTSDNGVSKLRNLEGQCKKIIEEILPIASFLGYFERPGLILYCQYHTGNQNYDARLFCDGPLVGRGYSKEYYLEVTVAQHENEHLVRECLEKGIACFGPLGITSTGTINSVTRKIESKPCVSDPQETIDRHLRYIKERIEAKQKKEYKSDTFLIVSLSTDTVLMKEELLGIFQQVGNLDYSPFCGLFLVDHLSYQKVLF